jgi:hypothetical protein
MEMNNADESMGLDGLLCLASGLPSHDSTLEDPLAMNTSDWVTSESHGTESEEGEKNLEASTPQPTMSTFTTTSDVNVTSDVCIVEEIEPTKVAALELGVNSVDSTFSTQD